MATQPRPSTRASDPPLRHHEDDHPVPAPVTGSEVVDPNAPKTAPAPEPPVKTIADEQRERSAHIEEIGVEAFKAETMPTEAQPKQVAGVAPAPPHEEPHRRIEGHKAS